MSHDGSGVTVEGPAGSIAARVAVRDGRPTIAVERDGREVVHPSPIGLHTFDRSYVDGPVKERGRTTIETTYRTLAGKRREHSYRAAGATVAIADEACKIDVRVAPDGVAYRYRLSGNGPVLVTGEESAFRLPESDAWVMPLEVKHEAVWRETTATDAGGQFTMPALFETPGGWVLLAEAGVDGRYVASHFTTDGGDREFRVRFPDSESHRMVDEPQHVSANRPLATPWRLVVAGDLADVVETNLVTDVVGDGEDPSRIADASWVQPGRAAWSWWSGGFGSLEPDVQKRFADYAAERDWEYVLVDDGWEAEWVPEVVDYANERGVEVLLWSRWSDLNTFAKRAARLPRWSDWGIAGLKVDFMNSDSQEMMGFYDDLCRAAAEHGMVVNFHGSIPPRGLRRRWPNVLTVEGVFGAENYHPVPNTIPPEHNVVLPFTRNAVGSMDYTPVTFSAETRQTTVGHELALAVVFESGIQHFADGVEEYASRPAAERFLERVPAAWDETRFLGGRPGERATLARRRGDEWFVGTIVAGPGRTVELSLDGLPDGSTDAGVVVYRDDDAGEAIVRETRPVDDGSIAVVVPENGGFAAHLPSG